METQTRESANSRVSAVLKTAVGCLRPAQLPSHWQWLSPARDCYRGPDDAELMLNLLCDKHDEQSLLQSRVVARDESGRLTLARQLLGQDRSVIVLRRPNGVAFDLLADNGSLFGLVPLFALWDDALFQNHLVDSQNKFVFGLGSFSDCLLLRSLGVPASPVNGLERLGVQGLRKLLHLVGASLICDREWMRQDPTSGRFLYPSSRCTLLLVTGSMEEFQPGLRDEVMAVVRHLDHAECELNMVFEDLRVWCPDDEKLAALLHARQVGDPELMRRAFARPGKTKCIREFVASPPSVESPTDAQRYLNIRAEFQRLMCEGAADKAGREKRKVAREKFESLVHETLISPVLTEAFDSSEPVRRMLGVQFAETAERVKLLSVLAGAELQELFRQANRTDQRRAQEHLKELPRHTNDMLKLAREYRRQQGWKCGWGN